MSVAHWAQAPLADVADLQLGKMLDRARHGTAERLPYLRNINVRWFDVDLSDLLTMPFDNDEREKFALRHGDVLVCEGGEPGRAAVWHGSDEEVKFQKAIHRVRLIAGIEPEWLVYHLKADASSGKLAQYFSGTTIKHFTGVTLSRYELSIPPIGEQRRIVSKLRVVRSRVGAARAALESTKLLIQKFRQSLLDAAFRGDLTADWREKNSDVEPASVLLDRIGEERRQKWEEAELAKMQAKGKTPNDDRWKQRYVEGEAVDVVHLPNLPDSWCWVSLARISWDAGYGTSEKCEYTGLGPAVLRIPNIAAGQIDLSNVKRASRRFSDDAAFVRPGDLLIIRTNGSLDLIGRAAAVVTPFVEETSFASYLIRYRIVGTQLARWASRFLASPAGRCFVQREAATSAGQYNVSLSKLDALSIPVPSAAEMQEILRRLEVGLSNAATVEATLVSAMKRLDDLESTILAKALRGELVSQDPNDQPASVLLKNIHVRRAAAIREPKGSRRMRTRLRMKGNARMTQSLMEVINASPGGVTPEMLFANASYSAERIDEFFQELRDLIEAGVAEERRTLRDVRIFPVQP